jgi:hypothetical protein
VQQDQLERLIPALQDLQGMLQEQQGPREQQGTPAQLELLERLVAQLTLEQRVRLVQLLDQQGRLGLRDRLGRLVRLGSLEIQDRGQSWQ